MGYYVCDSSRYRKQLETIGGAPRSFAANHKTTLLVNHFRLLVGATLDWLLCKQRSGFWKEGVFEEQGAVLTKGLMEVKRLTLLSALFVTRSYKNILKG